MSSWSQNVVLETISQWSRQGKCTTSFCFRNPCLPTEISLNTCRSPGADMHFRPRQRRQFVITQNCTQVVGGTLRGNSKTTLGRYWYFSPREGSLNTNLTKSNDKQYLSIHSFGWNQSHIHWAWSHIQVKDHKDTYTRTIKGKIITSLLSLSLIWVKRKRWEDSPSIQSV